MYSFTIGTSTSIESIWYYRLLEDSGQELWLKLTQFELRLCKACLEKSQQAERRKHRVTKPGQETESWSLPLQKKNNAVYKQQTYGFK
jgi:hypothetical protein